MSKVVRCAWCGLATPLGNSHLGCPSQPRPRGWFGAALDNAAEGLLDVRTQVGRSLLDCHLAKAKSYNLTYEDLFAIVPRRDPS